MDFGFQRVSVMMLDGESWMEAATRDHHEVMISRVTRHSIHLRRLQLATHLRLPKRLPSFRP